MLNKTFFTCFCDTCFVTVKSTAVMEKLTAQKISLFTQSKQSDHHMQSYRSLQKSTKKTQQLQYKASAGSEEEESERKNKTKQHFPVSGEWFIAFCD